MKTIEIQLYKFDELSSEAKENAIQNYRNKGFDDFWGDERIESYNKAKAIYDELAGIEEEIAGARLVAWIENNLSHHWTKTNRIGKHDLKNSGVVTKRRFKDGFYFSNSDYEYKYDCIRYRTSNVFKTNNIDNCPLTGVCYDYDFLEPIIKFMKNPKSNVTNLDLVDDMPSYEFIADRDFEYQNSDEYIIEAIEANEYDFTEDGEIY
jgi:hypothetical protein